MATQRQIEANRENALKSTGPKSAAGKAASSANALSHGLTAAHAMVLPDEDEEAFERLRQGVIADLEPAGALQEALAQRIAVLLWRLDRTARLEAELFVHGQLALERRALDGAQSRAVIARSLADLMGESKEAQEKLMQMRRQIDASIYAEAPSAQVLVERRESGRTYDQLARHEATLQRALNRTLEEFRRLRDASDGAAKSNAAPPAAPPDPDLAPTRSARPPAPQGTRSAAGGARVGARHGGEKALPLMHIAPVTRFGHHILSLRLGWSNGYNVHYSFLAPEPPDEPGPR